MWVGLVVYNVPQFFNVFPQVAGLVNETLLWEYLHLVQQSVYNYPSVATQCDHHDIVHSLSERSTQNHESNLPRVSFYCQLTSLCEV